MAKHPAQLEQYDSYIRRKRLVLLLTGLLTLLVALVYLGIGSMRIPLREILRAFAGTEDPDSQGSPACPHVIPIEGHPEGRRKA